jgi:hypothetical protein
VVVTVIVVLCWAPADPPVIYFLPNHLSNSGLSSSSGGFFGARRTAMLLFSLSTIEPVVIDDMSGNDFSETRQAEPPMPVK